MESTTYPMTLKSFFLTLLLLTTGGSLFAQGIQNVKGTYGCGSPQSSNVPGDIGSRYIDQCAVSSGEVDRHRFIVTPVLLPPKTKAIEYARVLANSGAISALAH